MFTNITLIIVLGLLWKPWRNDWTCGIRSSPL